MEDNNAKAYWSATLGLLTKVLVIWAVVSYGAGILFAPILNSIHLGGYPLGFGSRSRVDLHLHRADLLVCEEDEGHRPPIRHAGRLIGDGPWIFKR